jgi:hypothetical protein
MPVIRLKKAPKKLATIRKPRKPAKPRILEPLESVKCQIFVSKVKLDEQLDALSPDFRLIHIPNEHLSKGNYGYLRQRMRMGLLPGVSDYIILYKNGWAAIEFKRTEKDKNLNEKQSAFRQFCLDMKAPYLLTTDFDEALEFVKTLKFGKR